MISRLLPGHAARDRKRTVLRLVAQRLRETGASFIDRHDAVVGPGGCSIALVDSTHSTSPRHLDLGFVMDPHDPEGFVLDCVEAPGDTDEESWRNAINVWASTTAMAVIEGLARNDQYATHVHGGPDQGFPGWHAVVGGAIGWGQDDPDPLAAWFATHDWLAVIAPALAPSLERQRNNGIKAIIGGRTGEEIVEVSLNSRVHPAATAVLAGLDWPRSRDYARTFALLLHRES